LGQESKRVGELFVGHCCEEGNGEIWCWNRGSVQKQLAGDTQCLK
jgi:hypothetical protein